MDQIEHSPMELALGFIADHPELAEKLEGEQFQTFWEHPEEVLKQYHASTEYLKVSFQFTDEMINENCLEYLGDACTQVDSDLNPKEV